jgi:hypothetical protein
MIAMNSKNQLGYLFNNNYPQPLKIEKNSEICLQKFVHSRDKENFYITNENNLIAFVIGNDEYNGIRSIRIAPGDYTATQLVAAINTGISQELQQQNFSLALTEQVSLDPAISRFFTFTYDALPSANFPKTGGVMVGTSGNVAILNDDAVGAKTRISIGTLGTLPFDGGRIPKGVLTHGGVYEVENIAPNPGGRYGNYSFGLVRNQTSEFTGTDPNVDVGQGIGFAHDWGDITFEFDGGTGPPGNKLNIYMVSYDPNPALDYEEDDWRRKQEVGFLAQASLLAFLDPATTGNRTEDNLRLTFRTIQSNNPDEAGDFIVQLASAPLNDPENYTFMPDGVAGNYNAPLTPADGLPIIRTETIGTETYNGVIFYSKDNSYISVGGTADISKRAPTIYAPFVPFVAINNEADKRPNEGYLDLPAGNSWAHSGAAFTSDYDDVGQTEYWDYREVISNGAIRYWRHLGTSGHATNTTSSWGRWTTAAPTDFSTPPDEDWTANHTTGVLTRVTTGQTFTPAGAVPIVNDPRTFRIANVGNLVANAPVRSLENAKEETATRSYIDLGTPVASLNPTTDAPPDVPVSTRAITIYLDKIFEGDVVASMGRVLGFTSEQTDQTGAEAIYTSVIEPEGASKNTTLHISLAELNNIRTYEGGILDTQLAGATTTNYDANGDITNTIAVIPRNEFSTIESTTELAFVAPYENWVKVNNNTDVLLNQLTLQVRDADGNLSTDLLPETQAVFKMRRSPEDLQTEMIRGIVDKIGAQQTDAITFTAS